MVNETIYPFGTEGTLPSSIGLINDLKTGGVDKGLTAEQGKVIGGLIYEHEAIDLSALGYNIGGIATGSGLWTTNDQYKYTQIKVTPGEVIEILANVTNGAYYAYFSELGIWSSGGTPPYISGETGGHWTTAGKLKTITIPDGCQYLYLSLYNQGGSGDLTPESVSVRSEVLQSVKDGDSGSDAKLSALQGKWHELFSYADAVVQSTDATKISIEKNNGEIIVENIVSTSNKYALIKLPENLVPGVSYRVEVEYTAGFDKSSADGVVWWLGVADSSYASRIAMVGIYPGRRRQSIKSSYVFSSGDVYLRLASLSQSTGAKVVIHSISITDNKTNVADLSNRVSALETNGGDMDNMIRQARFVALEPATPPLTLLHFSDIHGDSAAAAYIKDFATKYSGYIDDLVQTGDAVLYYFNSPGQGYEWYQQKGIPEALFVIGNHDGAANDNSHGWKEGSADWDFKGKEWDFDTYFADYISERGVTPPSGYDDPASPYYKALYWHKDYSDAKVRVIGLDCMHFNDGVRYTSDDQETWLAAKLQETLTSGNPAYGFSVLFLCHYPLDDYSGNNEEWNEETHKFTYNRNETGGRVIQRSSGMQVAFHNGSSYTAPKNACMRNRVGSVGSTNYQKGDNNPLADVIQAWMNNGGKYIAWLSGHVHIDYMFYPTKYPDMLTIGIAEAGNERNDSEFADRSETSKMRPCANLIVIDTQNSRIKIIRVGFTLDKDLISRTVLAYKYDTRAVLSR